MLQYTHRKVPIANIRMSKQHWKRKIKDSRVKELASSMEEVGNISPIIVRKGRNGKYELLAGERRYRAIKKLKLTSIECRIVQCDDEKAELLSLQENLMIDSPDSKEWKAGVRQMHAILTTRYEQKEAKKPKTKKPKKKKKGPIPSHVTGNSTKGRPKLPSNQAH